LLKLLLDEHISPDVAAGVRRRSPSTKILALAEWDGGNFIGRDDAACLTAAAARGLTLVTYDRRTIPPLLKTWTEEGRSHAGVIFVDEKTISPADIGGLVRALVELEKITRRWKWTDRVVFLRR
jgi:predicted nucleic acid-binding protein